MQRKVIMAIQGEVYASIDAQAVDVGIRTMAISGSTDVAGSGFLTVLIHWSYDPVAATGGISGTSWYCNDANGPIRDYNSDEAFNAYLQDLPTDTIATAIESYMSNWTIDERAAFLNANTENVAVTSCLSYVIGL